MLLEAKAVTMFNECFTLYYQWVSKLRPSGKSTAAQDISKMASVAGNPCISRQQVQCQEAARDGLDALCMSILHLSLILVERHESGTLPPISFSLLSPGSSFLSFHRTILFFIQMLCLNMIS